ARADHRARGDDRRARGDVELLAAEQPRRRRAARACCGRRAPRARRKPAPTGLGGGGAVSGTTSGAASLRTRAGRFDVAPYALLVPLLLGACLLSLWIGRTSTGPMLGFGDAAIAGP